MSNKIIGLSLSFCVKDIANGHIQESQVNRLIAGTMAANDDAWKRIFADYSKSYWELFPEEAIAIAWRLIRRGIVEQPRLNDGNAPGISRGHWLVDDVQGFMYKGQLVDRQKYWELWEADNE